MKITLTDLEKDLTTNGITENFQQAGNSYAFLRMRPIVKFYNPLNKNYQTTIKQLNDMLPKNIDLETYSELEQRFTYEDMQLPLWAY